MDTNTGRYSRSTRRSHTPDIPDLTSASNRRKLQHGRVNASPMPTVPPRHIRSGEVPVNHYSIRHSRSAHKRAARQFPTYDTSAIRPRHSKRFTALVVVLILIAAAAAVFGGMQVYNSFTADAIKPGTPVNVVIAQGASTSQISTKLKDSGVISDEKAFKDAVSAKDAEQKLQPGTYDLTTGMDAEGKLDDLVKLLMSGPAIIVSGVDFVVPENFTIDLVAARVAHVTNGRISETSFLAEANAANKYVASYPFLANAYNNSMEGFLFPKTYKIADDATAEDVITMMLDQYAKETATIDYSYAQSQGLSERDVIIIASLIEKEAMADAATGYDERGKVSSVIYNRLSIGYLLQMCSSVVYVLGNDRDYAANPLTYDDIAIDSPYNTYIYAGLPPGPVCSPGLASIKAAAHPEDTDYFFFVLNPQTGQSDFSVTQSEHDAKVAIYGELNYRG
ncbi:MAG: endolytic transglycosylase MltG [Coriobacteriales bacterium]|nr:endolytic transglycosylase MltG [Coriobacteriales bacterium]